MKTNTSLVRKIVLLALWLSCLVDYVAPMAGKCITSYGKKCPNDAACLPNQVCREPCGVTKTSNKYCFDCPCVNGICTESQFEPSAADIPCECFPGWTGTFCDQDVNECEIDTDNCGFGTFCINTVGSCSCQCCSGFEGNGTTCSGINECTPSSKCDENATCTDATPICYGNGTTSGSQYICTCNPGYVGDGLTCWPSIVGTRCDGICLVDNATCVYGICQCDDDLINVNGECKPVLDHNEYCNPEMFDICAGKLACIVDSCGCISPSVWNSTSEECEQDIDECAGQTDDCGVNAFCTNTVGSFTCSCCQGFEGSGTVCTGIDECSPVSPCDENAVCTNTSPTCDRNGTIFGSLYSCICNPGYVGDGFTCCPSILGATCEGTCLNDNATCVNRTCQCDEGLTNINGNCETGLIGICEVYLVSGQYGIPDSMITVSSKFGPPNLYGPEFSRLNTIPTEPGTGAWSAGSRQPGEYIQAEFVNVQLVTGVSTQGRPDIVVNPQYVSEYSVAYSLDCDTFTPVTSAGVTQIFPGNFDGATIVTNRLTEPVYAKCVRLVVVSKNIYSSMRFDLLGCDPRSLI